MGFLRKHLGVKRIYFNGKNARFYYDKCLIDSFSTELVELPSTSVANAWFTYANKSLAQEHRLKEPFCHTALFCSSPQAPLSLLVFGLLIILFIAKNY